MMLRESSLLKNIPIHVLWAVLVGGILYPSSISGEAVPTIQTVTLPNPRTSYWSSSGENLIAQKHQIRVIERDELFEALLKDRVTFLDIREPKEFAQSHIPNAVNIPFLDREAHYERLKPPTFFLPPRSGGRREGGKILIPYCNWDFRGYVAAVEMSKKGFTNLAMMYPHGLRGWIAEGLPAAGEKTGRTDSDAALELMKAISTFKVHKAVRHPERSEGSQSGSLRPTGPQDDIQGKTIHTMLRILPKVTDPRHIDASVGDTLILDLEAHEEDHWFVIPDFGVSLNMNPGESHTIKLNITKPGYFPFGCISCCTRYQCQIKQAILVDLKESVSYYGE